MRKSLEIDQRARSSDCSMNNGPPSWNENPSGSMRNVLGDKSFEQDFSPENSVPGSNSLESGRAVEGGASVSAELLNRRTGLSQADGAIGEPTNGAPSVRYVDVARGGGGVFCADPIRFWNSRNRNKSLDGPLLPTKLWTQSDTVNVRGVLPSGDSLGGHGSIDYSMPPRPPWGCAINKDSTFPRPEAGAPTRQFPMRNCKGDFFQPVSGTRFDCDDASSVASSDWSLNGFSTEFETESPVIDGVCDAGAVGYSYGAAASDFSGPNCQGARSHSKRRRAQPQPQSQSRSQSQTQQQPQPQPQPQPHPKAPGSNLSQEWLEESVRCLAADLGISVPRYNFSNPNINFARIAQFDDPNYLRMEDRAMFGLRLAQNKSFFGDGKYM